MAYNHNFGRLWINHDKKLAFLGIPKNASSSIRTAIGVETKRYTDRDIFTFGKSLDGLTVFTVIREPLDRFISGYLEILKRADKDGHKTKKRKFYDVKDNKHRFIAFVNELYDEMKDSEGRMFDNHIEKQTYYIPTPVRGLVKMYMDFELKKLSKDLQLEIPHQNKKADKDKDYLKSILLNRPKLLTKFRLLYKDDLKLYNELVALRIA